MLGSSTSLGMGDRDAEDALLQPLCTVSSSPSSLSGDELVRRAGGLVNEADEGLGVTMECPISSVTADGVLSGDDGVVLLNEFTLAQGISAASMPIHSIKAEGEGKGSHDDQLSSLALVTSIFPSPIGDIASLADGGSVREDGEGMVREEGRAPPAAKEALGPQPVDGLWLLPRPPEVPLPVSAVEAIAGGGAAPRRDPPVQPAMTESSQRVGFGSAPDRSSPRMEDQGWQQSQSRRGRTSVGGGR
ncbi:hypothetical protein Dimus_015930, partial [Dionaea muscipula]